MPWTNPVNPTPGSVITAAFAIANWLDPIRWLRLMTGNADPPGSNYVVTSDSTSATSWKTGALALTNVLGYPPANLNGDTFTGPVAVGSPFTVTKTDDAGNGGHLILQPSAGQDGAHMDATNNVFRLYGTTTPATVWQIGLANGTMTLPSLSSITTGSLQAAAPSAAAGYAIDADSNQFRVFNPANAARMLQFGLTTGVLRLPAIDANTTGSLQGTAPASAAGYVIDAFGNQFRVYNPADATRMLQFGLTTNTLQVGTATVITSATIGAQNVAGASNASQLGGMSPGNGAGQIPISNNLLCTQLIASGANNANQLNGQGPAFYQARANHTGTQLAATISDLASQTVAGASNSTSVGGRVPTATPTANAIPISDAAGKLDAWITAFTPGAYVPQGLIAMLEDTNPANMPTGWSRYTAANGMLIVGDGTTFSQTFTATNNYGSAWSHGHTDAGHGHGNVDHNHGATLLTVTGHTGTVSTSTPSVNVTSGAGGETYVPDHTHDAATGGGTLDVGGTTDSRTSLTVPTGTAAIGGTTWFPPMRSLMYIRKN